MKIQTREGTLQDIDQLSQLFDGYRIFYRKKSDLEGAKKFLFDRLERGDSRIFVAETESQQLVGFVQLYPLFSSTRMQRLWLLNDLYVDPEARNKGVGVALLERAKKYAKDTRACALALETEKINTIGNRLYPKMGFERNEASNFYEWNVL